MAELNNLLTAHKSDGYRVTRNIPLDNLQCQYYRDLVAGDRGPNGYIITQADIDNKLYEKVGVNCASPDVEWLPNNYNEEYYLRNPLIGEDGENLPIDSDSFNTYADSNKASFTTYGGGLVVGNIDVGEDGQLFGDSDGENGCTGELNGCFINGVATCEECVTAGVGNEGGEQDPDAIPIYYKCCSGNNRHIDDPLQDSFFSFGDACNLFQCQAESNNSRRYFHRDEKCYLPGGQSYSPHNIVYQHFDKQRSLAFQQDAYRFYPAWDKNTSDGYYYIEKSTYDNQNVTSYYDISNSSNDVYDSYQIGKNAQGTVVYSLPKNITFVCTDDDLDDVNYSNSDAVYSVQELANELPANYDSTTPGIRPAISEGNLARSIGGVGPCIDPDADAGILPLFNDDSWKVYIIEYLINLNWDSIAFTSPTVDRKLTHAASVTNGLGLDWWLDEDDINEASLELKINQLSSNSRLARDVLYRIGFPYPPLTVGGDKNPDCNDSVYEGYKNLINSFELELGIGTFFADFEIPGIKIEPTMTFNLDTRKGIDLRIQNLNSCDYVEFMRLPGGSSNGDGIYYKGSNVPEEYLDYNSTIEEYVKNFDCNTIFDRDLIFSRIRAVCKDGSNEFIAITEDHNHETLYFETSDKKFTSGKNACNAKLKQNSNQKLYYLSDEDYRESLGIYFYDTDNLLSDNFLTDFADEDFDSFYQYGLDNYVTNPSGLDVNEFLTEYLEFDNVDGFTNPYIASGWYYIKMDIGSNGIKDYETPVEGMLPYWSSNNNNCYSYDKCLVFDTTKNDEFGNNDVMGPYDWRQSIYTMIDNSSLSYKQKRKNQEYKVSFMMKTKPFNESTLLKDTGIHLIGSYMDSQDNHLSTDGEAAVNYRYEKLGSQNDTEMSHRKNTALQKNTNSQCSRNTHYDSHFADSNAKACYNCGVDVDTYCDEIRASFTNTKIDTWEKMEVTFRPDFVDYYLNFDGKDLKLMFSPLQIAVETPYDFLAGGLRRFTPGFVPEYNNFIYVDDADYFDNPLELKQIFGTSQNNEVESGSFTPVDLNKSSARVYIDDIKFTESFDFHPDCDVRKKLTNTTSQYSLMEYNSADIDETKAPLKAQFYFYPRENSDDVFSEKRFPHQEEFKYGQYYICNIDWGDGSPKEFSDKPKKLGPAEMIYHTYETSGVFEVKATMFRTKSEIYDLDMSYPENTQYTGIDGVGHNKKFIVKIFINKGTDDDFKYFGSDGFSYIPYNTSLPIIGGINNNGIYYKNLYRNLGFINTDDGVFKINIPYNSVYDKYKSEYALLKMDNSVKSNLDTFNIYNDIEPPLEDTSPDYLSTLPFPQVLEEYDINNDGFVPSGQVTEDSNLWTLIGRPDIAEKINSGLAGVPYSLQNNELYPYYNSLEIYRNPTIIANSTFNNSIISKDNIIEELGQSLGDCDLTNIKYYNKPNSIWEMLGFENQDTGSIGNPNNPRYWKNIIPEDYSIFNREGLSNKLIIKMQGRQDGEDGTPPHYNIIVNGITYYDGFITNALDRFPDSVIGSSLDYDFNIPIDRNLDVQEIKINYDNNGIPPIIEGDRNLYVNSIKINNVKFDGNPSTHNDINVYYDAPSIYNYMENNPDQTNYNENGVSGGGAMAWDGNMVFEIPTSYFDKQKINTFSEQDWLLDENRNIPYYPVLPKYGQDGKFIENNYPNNKIPFPLDGLITNENEPNENLIINIDSIKSSDIEFLNDNSGNNNLGFMISDYKQKFDNKTFQTKKTRFIDGIKYKKNKGAF